MNGRMRKNQTWVSDVLQMTTIPYISAYRKLKTIVIAALLKIFVEYIDTVG